MTVSFRIPMTTATAMIFVVEEQSVGYLFDDLHSAESFSNERFSENHHSVVVPLGPQHWFNPPKKADGVIINPETFSWSPVPGADNCPQQIIDFCRRYEAARSAAWAKV
jgi:hypothetical protein